MNDNQRYINKDIRKILEQEPAFKGTVLEGRKRRFTVINEKDRTKYLTTEENEKFETALFHYLGKIKEGRAKDGKEPFNNYIVMNLDEPYIDEMIAVMKRNGHWD